MDPIVFVVLAAVLIGVAFYVVALPLIQHARKQTSSSSVDSEQERLAELLGQRDATFQALRELSFDHRVGKITDEDFVAFEANLKTTAADTLRALDRWETEADDELDRRLERVVQARRAVLAAGMRPCPKCGQ